MNDLTMTNVWLAILAIVSLIDREVHPLPGAGPCDPAIGARLVLGAPLPVPDARAAVSTSLAFGGANVALVLTRWD